MAILDKWAIYDTKLSDINGNYKPLWLPHDGQLVIAEDNHRHKVVAAGRRFGKSNSGGVDKLLPEVFYTKPIANQLVMDGRKRIFWIVGPTFSDSEKEFRVIWNILKRLEIPLDKPSYNNPESGDMVITLWGGAMQIIAKSAQIPERLVGEGLSGVILSEAAKLKENIWPKFIRPTLGDFGGWSYSSSTPEGKNWFYRLWQQGQDPSNKQWRSWRMPAWRNQYVYTETGRQIAIGKISPDTPIPPTEFTSDSDVYRLLELSRRTSKSIYKLFDEGEYQIDIEILDSMNELTPEAFLQEICADFTEFVGRVFKEFDEETHVADLSYNPAWETYAAVDYGYSNPNVWLLIQVGPWNEINVLDEIYESGLDPEDFANEIRWRRLNPASLRTFYPDPADPLSTKILEKKLMIRAGGGTGGELLSRINHIRKALRNPRYVIPSEYDSNDVALEANSLRPQLMFDRRCKKTIEDMLNYKYPERKADTETSTDRHEKPMKKDDHGPEALGRFFAGHFGQYGKPHTRTRIHQANFSSKGTEKDLYADDLVGPQFWKKDEKYTRPLLDEKRREDFPVVNDPLGNLIRGDYDNEDQRHRR